MIGAISISAGGLAAASQRFAATAQGVAEIGTSLPAPTQIDLSATAVRLIEDKAAFGINAAVLRSSLDADKRVLDILV